MGGPTVGIVVGFWLGFGLQCLGVVGNIVMSEKCTQERISRVRFGSDNSTQNKTEKVKTTRKQEYPKSSNNSTGVLVNVLVFTTHI